MAKNEKARMSKSNPKAMPIVYFDINSILMTEWVSECQTINQTHYLQVLAKLQDIVCEKQSELWKNQLWILHQDL